MFDEEKDQPQENQPCADGKKIIVIGGGVAGCGTALKLADLGYHITLLEKDTLFSGSSGRNPGRMALGFHYMDPPTAKMCLRETIELVRAFPGFRIAEDKPWDHPLRHGRYFITKDSLFPKEKILATYTEVQKEYARLVDENPEMEVFGPPKDFFKIITADKAAYEKDVDISKIDEVIETPEHLLDCPKFLNHLADKVRNHRNITLHEKTSVVNAGHHNVGERFFVETEKQRYRADYVINSTWQNIESLNEKIGLTTVPSSRTNRLKVLAVVKLPETLRDRPSMFFCMGPHCMFSNMGNGLGMMTYAPVTNLLYSDKVDVDTTMQRYLDGDISQEEKDDLAKKLVAGVSTYIPEMQHAKIMGIRCGIVQTRGNVDIFDYRSAFHRRAYYAVEAQQLGWFSNPSMKLVYFLRNAEIIAALLAMHENLTSMIRHALEDNYFSTFSPDLLKMFVINIEKAIVPSEIAGAGEHREPDHKFLVKQHITDARRTMEQKKDVCEQLVATSRLSGLFKKCTDRPKQLRSRQQRFHSEPPPYNRKNTLSLSQRNNAILIVVTTTLLLGHASIALSIVTTVYLTTLVLNYQHQLNNQVTRDDDLLCAGQMPHLSRSMSH